MAVVYFHFHAELNYFLPPNKQHLRIKHFFKDKVAIKDQIEALGVPHPEVNCIEVNGKFVNFSYILQDGDMINVYPMGAIAQPGIEPPISDKRFALDVHLGKLASSLRLLGFDTLYRNDYEDAGLANISSSQKRILLTRDKGLLMRGIVEYGYYVRNTDPQKQIVEVLQRFKLIESILPFHRCMRCNGLLESVNKESVIEQLPPTVRSLNHEFHRCQQCYQVYWKGSHYEKLQQFIDNVTSV